MSELGLAVGVAAAASAGSAVVTARSESSPGAFGDGAGYRTVARGEPGAPPFQRRVLMPVLARRLNLAAGRAPDDPAGFRVVALAAVPAGAAVTGLLAAQVATELGADRRRARLAGALAAALVPAMPHSTRMAVQMPVFNDQLAVAVGGSWLLATTRESSSAVPLALLAGLTREQWVVAAAAVLAGRPGWRAQAVALLGATAVVAAQPRGPGSEVYPPGLALRRLVSREGAAEVAWGLGSVIGPLAVLVPGLVRLRSRSRTLDALLRVVAVQTGLALVGGSDTPRLLHGGLPFLVAAGCGAGGRRLVPALAAALALWRPLDRLGASEREYEEHFLPYMHGRLRARALDGVARVAAAAGLVIGFRRLRRG